MEISSYECIGRGGVEIKLGEQDTFTAASRGRSGPGIGDRPEYWTTGNIDANKNLRLNLGRGITYGDSTDSLMISRDGGVPEEARNWPLLPGSNGIEGPEPMPAVLVGRGSQVGSHPAAEDRGTPGRDKCVGDVLEDVGGGDNGERWDAAALREDRGSIQKGERAQVDWSIQNRQRGLEGGELWVFTGERGGQEERWGAINAGGSKGRVEPWVATGGGGHVTYRECQKNQSADRGITSVDGCGEFMLAGKDGRNSLACAACGCHRNFHRRVLPGEEERDPQKREREEGAGNSVTSICNIERVAHELMAAANRVIPLSQDSLCYRKGRARDLSIKERNTMAKISIENLDHIAKMMLSTAECLTLLQKPLSTRQTASSRDRDSNKSAGASPPLHAVAASHEGPLSSDVSPVSTVEKRAISLPPPLSLQPCGTGGPQLMTFSGGCGMHNCMSISRKLSERSNHKSKRTRTRISLEQREKLNAFAEKAGWTVVGQRKETIEAACQDIGIEPKTLKYWIHNSKQKWKRLPGPGDDDMMAQ